MLIRLGSCFRIGVFGLFGCRVFLLGGMGLSMCASRIFGTGQRFEQTSRLGGAWFWRMGFMSGRRRRPNARSRIASRGVMARRLRLREFGRRILTMGPHLALR